jgi:hypothetical protein
VDTNEAREHLEMVDRILSRAEPAKNYRPWTWAIIIVGIAAALIQAGGQAAVNGHGYAVEIAGAVLMGCGYIYMAWVSYGARRNVERMSTSEARIGKACSAVWVAVVIAFFAQPHIWSMWAAGAIWNLGGAIQMLMFGFFGDRRALIGGLLLAISIVAANYVSAPGYALAAGFVLGYVVPGVLTVIDKDESASSG